jgi:hypothetical protein
MPTAPPGVQYLEVEAANSFTLLRRSDGYIDAVGINHTGQCDVPTLQSSQYFLKVSARPYCYHAIALVGDACGPHITYCSPGAPNSVSAAGASFSAIGCSSISGNALTLAVADVPPGKPGIFFYGPYQTQIPFGNGWVCVGGMVQRVNKTQWADGKGVVRFPVDLTQKPFASGPGEILPGSTWNFQFWYRDPDGFPTTFNLSNALQIVFAP